VECLKHLAEADRREVEPPIHVQMATWASAGQLDWWVKDRRNGSAGYAVQTAVNGGSERLIFDRRTASDHGTMSNVRETRPLTLVFQ
jgi:hypothetical protein